MTTKPPPPPPCEPDLDLICYIEDPWHGPSRPKTWRCWLIFWRKCPHRVLSRIAELERELDLVNGNGKAH